MPSERWKERRNALFGGGLQVTGASTFAAAVTFAGANTHTANIAFSGSAGLRDVVENVTSTGTLSAYGVSFIGTTSTADQTFVLPNPPAIGLHKHIVVNSTAGQAGKVTVTITATTTTGHLFGSTFRTIDFSTAHSTPRALHLVARTTSQWGVVAASTNVNFSG